MGNTKSLQKSMYQEWNKTFTSVISEYGALLFQSLETIATLVNYTCKSDIRLTPEYKKWSFFSW